MARRPNHEYYPKEWANKEDFVLKDEDISLNPVQNGRATPYAISPQVAEFTKKFGEELAELPTAEEQQGWGLDDWQNDYLDNGSSYFIPENRWTHEVVAKPVLVSDSVYRIDLSADAYIKARRSEYNLDKYGKEMDLEFDFVTRTLHKYIDDHNTIIDTKYHTGEWCLRQYFWIIRWLPRKNCTIRFYTTEDIEKQIHCKVDDFVIECNSDVEGNIEVPVMFKKSLYRSIPYIKHDTPILYMEIKEYE